MMKLGSIIAGSILTITSLAAAAEASDRTCSAYIPSESVQLTWEDPTDTKDGIYVWHEGDDCEGQVNRTKDGFNWNVVCPDDGSHHVGYIDVTSAFGMADGTTIQVEWSTRR